VLANKDTGDEPMVNSIRTRDPQKTLHPNDLAYTTFWRPAPEVVGNATCRDCTDAQLQHQARACHRIGAVLNGQYPSKRNPDGRQHYRIDGDTDGFFFVVLNPVSIDPSRQSFMSAWVHISATQEQDTVHAFGDGYVEIWATIQLADGTALDVTLLRTEGSDINDKHWQDNTTFSKTGNAWCEGAATAGSRTECEDSVGTCDQGAHTTRATCEASNGGAGVFTSTASYVDGSMGHTPGSWPQPNHAIEDAWIRYTAVFPATTRLA
jgi:hypothetical protein